MSAHAAATTENLYLRGNIWYVRVQIAGKDVRKSLGKGSRADAEKARDRLLAEAQGFRQAAPVEKVETWDEALIAYSEDVLDVGGVAPVTGERYRDSFRVAQPFLAGLPLNKITNKVLSGLVTARSKTVKPATMKRDLTAISRVIAFARSRGVDLETNVAKEFERSFWQDDQSMIVPPSDAEVARAIELISDTSLSQWPLLIRWLRETGMRLGETIKAHRRDLSQDAASEQMRLTISKPKGARRGRARTIDLSPEATALLPLLTQDGYLFDELHRMKENSVSTTWGKFRESREGMPRFRLHDLRHAYAVGRLRANPTHLYRLSRHLGHSTVQITQKYYLAFLSDEQQYRALHGE